MKKIFILLSVILLILIIISVIFAYFIVRKPQTKNNIPSKTTNLPTLIPLTNQPINLFSSPTSSGKNQSNSLLPVKTDDFEITFTPQTGKYLIVKKTVNAGTKIEQWKKSNGFEKTITEKNSTTINDLSQGQRSSRTTFDSTPTAALTQSKSASPKIGGMTEKDPVELLAQFVDLLFSAYSDITPSVGNPVVTPSGLPISPTGSKRPSLSVKPPALYKGLVYYPQCSGSFDNYPLPDGCTICKAGCGSTTASMILASYVDSKYNPASVADLYGERGYYLGCDGSRLTNAKDLLDSYGLKTSDYIIGNYDGYTINEVADDFKKYIKSGWTIFTLARFEAGGHFFWVIDVDNDNNVWAFDPFYGRRQLPPFNENQYYPDPKYIYAFGVKK